MTLPIACTVDQVIQTIAKATSLAPIATATKDTLTNCRTGVAQECHGDSILGLVQYSDLASRAVHCPTMGVLTIQRQGEGTSANGSQSTNPMGSMFPPDGMDLGLHFCKPGSHY